MNIVKKICFALLSIYGRVVYCFKKLNSAALREFKTNQIRKKNPGVLFVGGGTSWNHIRNLKIGVNSYINGAELLTTDDTEITIGKNCLISYDVVIRTDTHNTADRELPIIEQGNHAKSIYIGDNVWVGQGVYIMPGVHIGDNSIIGAKAVVTKDIPADSIAVGIPARVVKSR